MHTFSKGTCRKNGITEEIRTLGTKEYIWQISETQRAVRITVEDLNLH